MEPLPDSTKFIRLLKITPGKLDDGISVLVSFHSMIDLPKYLALSYAWGQDRDRRAIMVNSTEHTVTTNCHYALSQTRRRYSNSYIWIDSLCIRQDDEHEKSNQVMVMRKIYAQAVRVLACIGPQFANDEYQFKYIPEWHRFIAALSDRDKEDKATVI